MDQTRKGKKDMKYEIDTIQYSEIKDTYKHQSMGDLLRDLWNIHAVGRSTQIVEIRENGKPMSKTKIKVLKALAIR